MSRPWLTRTLVVLTAVSLTQDAASELLYPLLPLLLTGTLGAPAAVVGIVEGSAELAAGVSKYVAGRLSDRTKTRKPWILSGYGLAALGKVIVAAAGIWPIVLIGRVVDRVGKGVRSAPRDSLLARDVAPGDLGRTFGFHRAGDTLGAVIGPLIGLAALSVLGDLRLALWVAVVPAVASVLLVLLIRERPRDASSLAHDPALTPSAPAVSTPPPDGSAPLPAEFTRVVAVLTVVALVNIPDALLLLRLSENGWSATQVVLGYVLFNLTYTLASFPAGVLSDRLGRHRVYALGLACFAVAYVGLGLVSTGPWPWLLLVLYGLFPGLTDGVGKAWISSLVPDAVRGRAQGIFQALGNGSVFVAGLWGGLAWTLGRGNGTIPLVMAGLTTGAAAVAVLVWLAPRPVDRPA